MNNAAPIASVVVILIILSTCGTSEGNPPFFKSLQYKGLVEVPELVSDFVQQATSAVRNVPKQITKFFSPTKVSADTVTSPTSIEEIEKWNFFGDWFKDKNPETTRGLDTIFNGYGRFNFIREIKAIVPGTNFCGQGDIAGAERSLGYFNDVDACCKEHDECPQYILPGDKLHGLDNAGLFTRSHCACDNQFYKCLKKLGNVMASNVGFTFFTVLGPQCFKEEHAVVKCLQTSWGRCIRYEFDKYRPKKVQWFDNPIY